VGQTYTREKKEREEIVARGRATGKRRRRNFCFHPSSS
jgi:hypothetical protein